MNTSVKFRSEEQIGEKVKFDGVGDDEEDPVDEYSSQLKVVLAILMLTLRS